MRIGPLGVMSATPIPADSTAAEAPSVDSTARCPLSGRLRAELPPASVRTWSSVAMVVSPGKRGQQRAVRPSQAQRRLRRLAGHEAVEEPGGKAVPAADPVVHVELTTWER